MKPAGITRSWIVYPPNYQPGDGYKHFKTLKKAWNVAVSMGVGSECHLVVEHWNKKYSTSSFGHCVYVVEDAK